MTQDRRGLLKSLKQLWKFRKHWKWMLKELIKKKLGLHKK